jgi:Major Facilitator Superfamily
VPAVPATNAAPSPLKSGRLRRIVGAYAVNRLGTWLGLIALMLAVFDHTRSSLAVAGLLLAGQALPAFVVPVVVARVEASKRRGELSGLYFFEAIATAALAVLLWNFSLPLILLVAALDGTAALTASSLLRSELARAAREDVERAHAEEQREQEELQKQVDEAERKANAALNVAFSTVFVLGPALSGVVVAAAGASTALFIDVGSFIVCGALLLDLHPHVEEAAGESVAARLRAAWGHINEAAALRGLLLLEALALICFESAGPIEVSYAKATLHAGSGGFGLLVSIWGAGGVLGSVVFARYVKRSLGILLSAGALAVGAAYLGFAAAPTLALACPAAFVGGIGNGVQWPSLISIVQQLTPSQLLGRLMGAVESLGALCLALGLALGGALVAVSSTRIAFLVVGGGAVATTFGFLRVAPRERVARDEQMPPIPHPPAIDQAHEPLPHEVSGV